MEVEEAVLLSKEVGEAVVSSVEVDEIVLLSGKVGEFKEIEVEGDVAVDSDAESVV